MKLLQPLLKIFLVALFFFISLALALYGLSQGIGELLNKPWLGFIIVGVGFFLTTLLSFQWFVNRKRKNFIRRFQTSVQTHPAESILLAGFAGWSIGSRMKGAQFFSKTLSALEDLLRIWIIGWWNEVGKVLFVNAKNGGQQR